MKTKRKVFRSVIWTAFGFLLLGVIGRWAVRLTPLPRALGQSQISQLDFVDRNGLSLRAVRPGDGPFREAIGYSDIPESLVHATLAAEDQRFWLHAGVDGRAVVRAAWQWVSHHRVISGGSTITQQLIKLAAPRPRTLRAKLIEAFQALRLEQVWSKQQILCEYLNRLDYGNFNRGCASAAQFYFAKPLRDLSAAEAALLASLPQGPSRLNPYLHLDRARKRQHLVLDRMRKAGWLEERQFQRACLEPLDFAPPRRSFEAPHFIDFVLSQTLFDRPADNAAVNRPVVTTLDLPLNRFAETSLRARVSRSKSQHVSNGAVIVLDNRTGDVLACVGSENYFAPGAGQVNGASAARSAGSTFKPFTYLLALERGATPATIVADVPTEFVTATGIFAPANYNHHCYGPMRYRLALANSLNISAVKVLASIGGPEPLLTILQDCGLSTLKRPAEHYGLGLTIGNAEARLVELANAYACLGRLGEYKPYRLFRDLTFAPAKRVADPAACFLIADILSDNDARALAFGPESSLRFDFPVACKTGTSSDFRDNWALGYTPEFTVGVWVGNFDGSSMQQVSGVTGAGPILHDVFEHLHQHYGTSWYSTPAGIVECEIHSITGKRLKRGAIENLDAVSEKFIAAHLPRGESPADYDHSTFPPRIVLSSEYQDWFGAADNWLADRAVIVSRNEPLRIIDPLPGARFYLDADLLHQGSKLPLRASGPKNLQWQSDSLQLVRDGPREIALLTEGRHQIAVLDVGTGTKAQTWIEVLRK